MSERKAPETISFYEHEEEVFRMERHCKRLYIALIVTIVLLFASNMGWLVYQSLYDTVSYEQDGSGLNNINTGTQGDVTSDGSEVEDSNKEESEASKGGKNSEGQES
jgi:predicted negative regulator of RcsB-dependent stress response